MNITTVMIVMMTMVMIMMINFDNDDNEQRAKRTMKRTMKRMVMVNIPMMAIEEGGGVTGAAGCAEFSPTSSILLLTRESSFSQRLVVPAIGVW